MRPDEQPQKEPQRGRPEETLAAMFDDLEMQAAGLHLSDRAVEVAELSVAQDAELDLLSRFHGSVGSVIRVGTCDGQEVRGTLAGAGGDWVMVDEAATTCFLPLHGVALVTGLGREAVPVQARALPSLLSFRSVLRRLADEAEPCTLHLRGGRVLHGSPGRVGADFVELRQEEPAGTVAVPLGALLVLRSRPGRLR